MENSKNEKLITGGEIKGYHPYPQFNCRCIIPVELDTSTISETPSSLVYLMILLFCKN
jgi:hypothetical protein